VGKRRWKNCTVLHDEERLRIEGLVAFENAGLQLLDITEFDLISYLVQLDFSRGSNERLSRLLARANGEGQKEKKRQMLGFSELADTDEWEYKRVKDTCTQLDHFDILSNEQWSFLLLSFKFMESGAQWSTTTLSCPWSFRPPLFFNGKLLKARYRRQVQPYTS
jgi:hypothetical protein